MPDTSAEFQIRSFRAEDLPTCRALYVDGLLGGKLAENDTGFDLNDIESTYINAPGNHFWVATVSDGGVHAGCEAVVGMIGVQQHDRGTGEIRRLRVAQNSRRRGIGSALMEVAVRFCSENNILKITLDTFVEREAGIRLFEKFGFRHASTRTIDERHLLYFYLDLYHTGETTRSEG